MRKQDRTSLTAAGLMLAMLAGCSSQSWAWSKPKTPLSQVETPAMRIAKLRELAKNVKKSTPEELELVSARIAGEFEEEEDPVIRAQQVRTLAVYPTDSAGAALTAALQDPDPRVQIAACEAWGKRGGAEASQNLSEVLATDQNVDVRLAATRALGEVGDSSAVSGLALALEDPNPAMQNRAVKSLEKVTGHKRGNNVDSWKQAVQNPQPNRMSMKDRFRKLF